jgi:hypothetical protein
MTIFYFQNNREMKFGIKKETLVEKTNIEGKVIYSNTVYKVYRKVFFGLVRMYIEIRPYKNYQDYDEVRVEYTKKGCATSFSERWQAKNLIRDIKINPDKFVRYRP